MATDTWLQDLGRQWAVMATWVNLQLLQQMVAIKTWGPQNQIFCFFQEKLKLGVLEKFAHLQILVIDLNYLKTL